MKSRKYTVGHRPSYYHWLNDVPQMRIGGRWMSKAGFNIGDHVDIILEENQIIIRPAADEISNLVEEPKPKRKR